MVPVEQSGGATKDKTVRGKGQSKAADGGCKLKSKQSTKTTCRTTGRKTKATTPSKHSNTLESACKEKYGIGKTPDPDKYGRGK